MSAPLTLTQASTLPARRFSGLSMCVAALVALYAACPATAPASAAAGKGNGATDTATPVAATAPAAVEFNTDFLSPQARTSIDVSRFGKGNPVLPGDYRVELYLNGRGLGRTNITVKPGVDPNRGRVCMTRALLDQVGVDWSRLDPSALKAVEDPAACPVLEDLLPNSRAELDIGELSLDLTLPQVALRRAPRGYVNPELWSSGVNGGMLGYTLNAYHNDMSGSTANSAYLGLNAGFNLGNWHFRHNGAENWQSGSSGSTSSYQNINTYVERELPSIMGRLTLGDKNTSGNLFDTQSFRGVQLASDDRMLPDSQRGYAPVVRGIAATNARVTIRQGGTIIYDAPVPPGPFVINDLYPTGYGGDLEVSVTEGDGRVSTFTVPYASVPQLLRPGSQRYSLTAGTVRDASLSSTPKLLEGTYQRGLTNMLTGYGGLQASDNYAVILGGLALGTPLGAISFDLSGARTEMPANGGDNTLTGLSARLSYSKTFEQTGSSVSLAAYRYSTNGFLDMTEAMRTIDATERGLSADSIGRPRSRFSVTLSQPLGKGWGQFYLSGYTQDYWNNQQQDTQFQAGYNNNFGSLMYSISAARMSDPLGRTDNRFMLSLSVPLGSTAKAPRLSSNVTHDDHGTSGQTMLTGTAGADNQFNYGASASYDPNGAGTAGTVNGQYIGAKTTASASYGAGRGYNNISAGLSGSVVAYHDGVTFSPYSGDTVAVVAAGPEAAGAHVSGYPNVILDGNGRALLPYLTPYRMNEVAIDPNGLPASVELENTSHQVAPRAGAIVVLPFAAVSGRAVLIDASLPGGAAVPFGADVLDGDGKVVGAVGQAGRIFAHLPADETHLSVRWGQGQNEQCAMNAVLPSASRSASPAADIERLQLACVPAAAVAANPQGTSPDATPKNSGQPVTGSIVIQPDVTMTSGPAALPLLSSKDAGGGGKAAESASQAGRIYAKALADAGRWLVRSLAAGDVNIGGMK